jgi:hypothetical protein
VATKDTLGGHSDADKRQGTEVYGGPVITSNPMFEGDQLPPEAKSGGKDYGF